MRLDLAKCLKQQLRASVLQQGCIGEGAAPGAQVQIHRKNTYLSETFCRYRDADERALSVERGIDLGETPTKRALSTVRVHRP